MKNGVNETKLCRCVFVYQAISWKSHTMRDIYVRPDPYGCASAINVP